MLHPIFDNEDIIKIICNFLEPEEASALMQVCKTLSINAKSPVIWHKYLNRLKAMDNSINTLKGTEDGDDWCYKRFVDGVAKISKDQQAHVTKLKEEEEYIGFVPNHQPAYAEAYFSIFKDLGPITNLKILEERHNRIQKIQEYQQKMTKEEKETKELLHFSRKLHSELPELSKSLETLYCDNKVLQGLPPFLGCERSLQFSHFLSPQGHLGGMQENQQDNQNNQDFEEDSEDEEHVANKRKREEEKDASSSKRPRQQ